MATKELRPRRQAPVIVKQEQDDDSDAEEPNLGPKKPDGQEPQIIHSGHFMVSSPHSEHPPKKGYDFDTVNKQTCQTYCFGKTSTSHLSIDASLTKLFECMTLAYSGKLVSPKWKNFKGLKLLWRDKIRLNNAIWRAWYMQYVEKRDNPVCRFVTPLDGSIDSEDHRRPEAIVTDGKNWKRRIEIVIREYHKWRTYFKKRLQKHKDDDLSSLLKDEEAAAAARASGRKSRESPVPMEMDQLFDMDMLMSEFSDTLFSTLSSHQAWPNPREIAHAGNADMIQPGLIPLQPDLGFMDTFEPFQDLFHTVRPPVTSIPSLSNSTSTQASILPPVHLSAEIPSVSLDHELIPSPGPAPVPQSTAAGPAFGPSYAPIFSTSLPPVPAAAAAEAGARAAPQPAGLPRAAPDGLPPSVITHTASSTVTPSAAATSFNQSPGLALHRPQRPAGPPRLAPPPRPLPALQSPQPFALPRPINPSVSGKKTKHLHKIVPAPKPVTFLATASFPGQPSAVIVTPGPLKTECVPSGGVVIAPTAIGRTSGLPEFHILQAQNSKHLIVPKEERNSLTTCTNQAPSPTAARDGRRSSQGSPCASEQCPSPQSPHGSSASLAKPEPQMVMKGRRGSHISAEQKRRFNIKIGFKTLSSLVSTLKSQSNSKPISNAATLQKTVEYIAKLQQERQQMQEEARRLKEEIEELSASINSCQEQLPATGVPITRHRFDHMRDTFDEYVKNRTLQNWKFWVFSIIIKPLFESFNGMVSTTSTEELCQTTLQWLDRHCSLPVLRPMVLQTLRQLSTTTSILSDPSLLPEQAKQAVTRISPRTGES
ncbi:MLX-interacting protein isoform X2 [Lepisosteus oculatus]|uniref:MLX-interacting protein isoform X2 n=1 Tax=Lepisosteus oculatus TaxID=7918 RepID=UPI0035F51A53